MAYSSKAVANYFLDLAKESDSSLTPMKLQKLIYFAHGWSLAIYDEPLISETIEAWRYGPVVPTIYHEFKDCGSGSITDFATEIELVGDDGLEFCTPQITKDDEKTKALLNKVWEIYGKYSGVALSNLTHKPETPWDKVWNVNTPKGTDIPQNFIKEYFQSIAAK